MASVWIKTRPTRSGGKRYRVEFRAGGREASVLYGGSFPTRREALARKAFIAGELAALRLPDLRALDTQPARAPTLRAAATRWRGSRIDIADGTAVLHRVALDRALPILGSRRVDEITPADVAELVATLHATGRKRETIRKTTTALAQVLDHAGINPNPARGVRLPHEVRDEIVPPTAEHVEACVRALHPGYRLAVLVLDATGMRVGELEHLRWGDIDERQRRWRVSRSIEKTHRGRWVPVPDDMFDAVLDLKPREDRDMEGRVFDGVTADRLRVAIGRACKASGTPTFSPHDLRHRRISLCHRHGVSWAEIGSWAGQRSLSVTADTYTHVLGDDREVDRDVLRSAQQLSAG